MRAYTLSLLNKLKVLDQTGASIDQQIVTWANNKVISNYCTTCLWRSTSCQWKIFLRSRVQGNRKSKLLPNESWTWMYSTTTTTGQM